ncbi:MAG: alpha/beta hydrolase [Acidobacteriota bacterium]|nr:alpha/beta hydrolase [Acidobacteriota bacterium]
MAEASSPVSAPRVQFKERRLTVEEGVSLRLFEWQPENEDGADPILFVAGWISLVTGWVPLLEKLVRNRPVYYLETREKSSAEITQDLMRPSSFSVPRLAEDLVEVSNQLDLDHDRAVLFGSSMGSNAILEALKGDRLKAKGAFVVGPNAEFHFPWWGRPLVHLPSSVYSAAKPFVLWYLRTFRVNEREDPEQMARYVRTVRAADPKRIMLSARAVIDYDAMPGLDTISSPVAVAYAANDTLHGAEEVQRIVDTMPRGVAVKCPSNTYMHTAEVVTDLDRFLAGSTEMAE